MIDLRHCEACPLKGLTTPCDVAGNLTARFMVVTDTPSKFNAGKGRLLSESAMGVFSKHMVASEFDREDFLFVPQVRCPYEADQYTTKQKREIQKCCREHFLDDIYEYRPEVLLPLGAEAAKQVSGRAVKITKARGVCEYSEEHSLMWMPLLNPGMVVMYPQHEPVFAADCRTLRRLVESNMNVHDASQQLLGNYEFIDDLEFLIEQKPKLLFYDTETTSLEYFKTGQHNRS